MWRSTGQNPSPPPCTRRPHVNLRRLTAKRSRPPGEFCREKPGPRFSTPTRICSHNLQPDFGLSWPSSVLGSGAVGNNADPRNRHKSQSPPDQDTNSTAEHRRMRCHLTAPQGGMTTLPTNVGCKSVHSIHESPQFWLGSDTSRVQSKSNELTLRDYNHPRKLSAGVATGEKWLINCRSIYEIPTARLKVKVTKGNHPPQL